MFAVGYLGWVLGIAGGLYWLFSRADFHSKEGDRDSLAIWLMERDENCWACHFSALFDYVFGPRHFSLRRILASAISSIITILALWVLFGPVLGLMGSRADITMPLGRILALGVAINLVADYFSLIETRWLLGRFEHVRNWFLQIILLLLDLAFSAAIILITIALSRWLQGERLLSPIELMAGYTPYAIFFYSTFLTSIWAWAFFVSAGIIRIFARTPLHKILDIEARPFTQIGLIAGLLIVGGLMGGKALTDRYMPDDIDGWICSTFGGYSCTHAARLSDDEAEVVERLKRACTTGDAQQCRIVIDAVDGKITRRIAPMLAAACNNAADAKACESLNFMYGQGLNILPLDYARNYTASMQSCEEGEMLGCSNLGFMYEKGLGVPQDYQTAHALYTQACEAGYMLGCNNLGALYKAGLGVPQDYQTAHALFTQACEGGDMLGCSNLGSLYHKGLGVTQDYARADTLYTQACEGGYMSGCIRLAVLLYSDLGGAADVARAKVLIQQACDDGISDACDFLEYIASQGN